MKLIPFLVMGSLLTCAADAQQAPRQWAGRAEYEMATAALAEKDISARVAGLLAWESAYPNSEFAPERTQSILAAYFQTASISPVPPQVALLYKVVALGPSLKNRSHEQTQAIRSAASVLLDELKKPGVVAPADARELAERALSEGK